MVFCNKQYKRKLLQWALVTILILIDGFLQCCKYRLERNYNRSHNPYFNRWFSAIPYIIFFSPAVISVTILILIDGFLQCRICFQNLCLVLVTILILIDGFLQLDEEISDDEYGVCHNPYFNRWFSAINSCMCYGDKVNSHNPYFNRWFSAILMVVIQLLQEARHNPYFNRWFSAIYQQKQIKYHRTSVTILILIDGFLQ